MKAIWNGEVIAESNETIMLEGNHYFPMHSINQAFFKPSAHTSICGWKGLANYLSVEVKGKVNENAAWVYAQPKAAAAEIAGHVAFWHGIQVTP